MTADQFLSSAEMVSVKVVMEKTASVALLTAVNVREGQYAKFMHLDPKLQKYKTAYVHWTLTAALFNGI